MKNLILVAIALLLASCGSESDKEMSLPQALLEPLVPVSVHINGFTSSQEDFPDTRATTQTPNAYDGIKAMTLAFYNGTTEVYKTTQLRDDPSNFTTFGDFELSLPIGSYTMVVLGYGYYEGVELTLTSPTQAEYTGGTTRETLAVTQTVNITSTNAVELEATLNRIVTQLKVISTDNRTDNVTNVRMTFSAGGKAFNPTTGLATSNTGISSTVGITTSVGARSASIAYLFLASDEQEMDVTIETLDSEGAVLFSKTVNNVLFQRNRITKLTGPIYSAASASSFVLNTDWLDSYNVNF